MTSDRPNTTPTLSRQQLGELRLSLLRLHKKLLDFERTGYEQIHGQVNAYTLLDLVMHDEWFDWLHPISQLVVQIDDLLKAEEIEILTHASSIINQARTLLNPSETGSKFEQSYFRAIQGEPDVVLAHADVMQFLAATR